MEENTRGTAWVLGGKDVVSHLGCKACSAGGGLGELGLALGWVQEPALELQRGFGDRQGGPSCTRAS